MADLAIHGGLIAALLTIFVYVKNIIQELLDIWIFCCSNIIITSNWKMG
jgi:prolipoprotein diacylglyceryltransferase